jgi:tRNA pseudouridine38-40 synthase
MAYDGSDYFGWQVQVKQKTVQQVLESALSTLLKQEIPVTGAGRTDTGVHASHFVAHFDLPAAETSFSDQFIFKLNRFLPSDIVVYRIFEVPDHLHARFSATYRTYHYHIATEKPLYRRNYSHYVYGEIDTLAISSCCKIILETRDFTSFAKLHTDVKTNECQVTKASWKQVEAGYLFEISANRFLRNMVRSITGTLLNVGRGKMDPEDFRRIVEAKDRGQASSSAPAKGLFLVDIGYPEF